jgi:hypothetical protein
VRDGRPISPISSSFVRLLGAGAFRACGPTRARRWVASSGKSGCGCASIGRASRPRRAPEQVCAQRLDREFCRMIGIAYTGGWRGVRAREACGGCAAGMLLEAPRARRGYYCQLKAVDLVDSPSPDARRLGRPPASGRVGEVAPRRTAADACAAVPATSRLILRSCVCQQGRSEPDHPHRFDSLTRDTRKEVRDDSGDRGTG